MVNGTVLTIYDSIATLDRVAFMSAIEVNFLDDVAFINSSEYFPTELSNRVIVVLSLARSDVVVTQSWFEGNNVGLGRVIDNYDSDITIFNTTFVNNCVKRYCCSYNCCFTGGIVYANNPHGSTMKLYDNKFVQNVGVVIFTFEDDILISHSKFVNNSVNNSALFVMVYATDSNLIIHYSTFINNTGRILLALETNMSINHSMFTSNGVSSLVVVNGGGVISVDHSKFTNNTGSYYTFGILTQ